MAYQIYAGSTSQTVRFFIQDTSSTAGAGLTGLTHSTSGLTCYYSKGIGAATSITLASQTATGAYTSGGFCAVDGTNMPGLYRLDLPDVVVDTEAEAIVMLRGAANMAPVAIRITCKKLQANAVTVADKTGYGLSQAFPANFATLGINGSGHVSRVTLVDTTTTNTDMRGTDGAALASAWTATRAGYMDSVLLAVNSNRTVQVTGSHHVAADIHELQPAVITADKFSANWLTAAGTAADYITELQTAIGTATNQTAIKVVTDRINTGLVADGAVWQFTVNMLELAPAGGGGGAGDASQATLLEVQDTVESIAASLSGVPITATGRIADGGSITLYCGDDLRVRSGSQITITVTDVGGSIYTRLDGIGEANLFWGASRRGLPASAISGSIASLSQSGSGASQTMTVVVEIDNAGASLQPAEDYTWQIESQQDYGTETDSLIEMEGVLSLRRRVV
jgi:hypothetical protein